IFFVFQAEDGIRDATVTGVQTCALPIYKQIADDIFDLLVQELIIGWTLGTAENAHAFREARVDHAAEQIGQARLFRFLIVDEQRSEERRVGREGRDSTDVGEQRKNTAEA